MFLSGPSNFGFGFVSQSPAMPALLPVISSENPSVCIELPLCLHVFNYGIHLSHKHHQLLKFRTCWFPHLLCGVQCWFSIPLRLLLLLLSPSLCLLPSSPPFLHKSGTPWILSLFLSGESHSQICFPTTQRLVHLIFHLATCVQRGHKSMEILFSDLNGPVPAIEEKFVIYMQTISYCPHPVHETRKEHSLLPLRIWVYVLLSFCWQISMAIFQDQVKKKSDICLSHSIKC